MEAPKPFMIVGPRGCGNHATQALARAAGLERKPGHADLRYGELRFIRNKGDKGRGGVPFGDAWRPVSGQFGAGHAPPGMPFGCAVVSVVRDPRIAMIVAYRRAHRVNGAKTPTPNPEAIPGYIRSRRHLLVMTRWHFALRHLAAARVTYDELGSRAVQALLSNLIRADFTKTEHALRPASSLLEDWWSDAAEDAFLTTWASIKPTEGLPPDLHDKVRRVTCFGLPDPA